jgi:starch-binding outer membrane protein, SusD/RagB family
MINNYDMKKISKIIILLFVTAFTLVGCDDLLNVNSDRQVFTNEYEMKAANDTLYSMFGVFSQLEKIADSYVLLGELRGDLMDVTDKSDLYLKEINNFNVSTTNPYTNNIKDYYSVINNCNYVIHNIDTSVVKASKKVMLKEYSACKAIRAWTYMQIALNYGSAIYYDKPILSVADANAIQKETPKTITELAPILIADLIPLKDIPKPYFGSLFSFNTAYSFFSVRFLLGDLYLWTGQYENAANEYHDLMSVNKYIISSNYRTTLTVLNGAFTGGWSYNFNNFITLSSENITNIGATNQYSQYFNLDSLVVNRMVVPSDQAFNNWSSQMYYYSNSLDTLCDTRRFTTISKFLDSPDSRTTLITENYIYKYLQLNPISTKKENKQITPYRVPLLYLRYAEAVNRIGKPNLALAVLKNGMNKVTLSNRRFVPKHEVDSILPNYMNFSGVQFDNNIGIRMRGCGNVNQDTTYYIIPKLNALQDSVLYVEDLIQKELALETAFEGNRFQDLMRFAIRRDDNAYLADKIALKHKENQAAIKTKLMDRANWFLK